MVGAIAGDIIGSRFEFNNHRSKEFDLFTDKCYPTDDSIMTIAIMAALLASKNGDYNGLKEKSVKYMRQLGKEFPDGCYGGRFLEWLYSENPAPYNSFGNGAAMRISPVAYAAHNLNEVVLMAKAVTEVTHNHPEGIKGAQVVAVCIWMALHGRSKADIESYAGRCYDLNFKLDDIRSTYRFNETCQGTVPQAIVAFLESRSFEDAVRNAVSIGGDSDTLAAIAGSIAEAYYGVPENIEKEALGFLPNKLRYVVSKFQKRFDV